MKLILLLLASFAFNAYASFPELFGASASSIAVGNQAEQDSAANTYYAGALLGYSKSTKYSFNIFHVQTDFKEISNITIKNDMTTVGQLESGTADVNPSATTIVAAHLSTPLFSSEGPKFNLSLLAPINRLMEADSGDPYSPNYVMYNSRFVRPVINFGLSQSFNDWAFSLGAQTGLQTNGESYFGARTSSNTYSVAKISFNAKPSMGLTASVAKKTDKNLTYLSFQQEMKSNFRNRASGQTESGGTATFPFDFTVSSLLYYEPMTLRAGHQINQENRSLLFTLEYQNWKHFNSSTMDLKQHGGVLRGSNDFEKLDLRNIFIPRIGLSEKITDQWTLKAGYFYRPTPLKTSALKNAGNSIDQDKHVGAIGAAYNFEFYGKLLTLDMAYQGHFLKSEKITKSSGREDGDPSQPKIGSPGYTIGGMIHTLALGLSWTL